MRKRENAFFKDSFRQVIKTMHRFLAILVITALGVAFFAGLRATGPDMRATAGNYLDSHYFMDIRLLSTVGFSDQDIRAIQAVEGLGRVMPAYSYDALAQLAGKNLTIRLNSLAAGADGQNSVNQPALLRGRMPEKSGECLADSRLVELSGWDIGDTVPIVSGTADPVADALRRDRFRIVGIAEDPLYISYERGASSVGSGKTDAFLLILPQDFAYDAYTEVYLTVANGVALSRFADAYGDLLEPAKSALEEMGGVRAGLRYGEIQREARQELDKAKAEVADGYRELDDAEVELADARTQLDDGWLDYQEGQVTYQTEIADAKQELADGWQDYFDGFAEFKSETGDAREQLDQGWQDYYAGLETFNREISNGESELAEARDKLDQGWQDYDEGLDEFTAQTAAAQQELDAGYAQYESGKRTYESGLAQYQDGLARSEKAQAELAAGEDAYAWGYGQYQQARALCETLEAALYAEDLDTIGAIASSLQGSNPALAAVLKNYTDNPADTGALYAAQGAVAALGSTLDETEAQLASSREELDEGWRELEAARQTLAASAGELAAAEAQLEEVQAQLDTGQAALDQARLAGAAELAEAKSQLLAGEDQLTAGEETLEREKAKGRRELDKGLAELQDGEHTLSREKVDAESKLAEGLADLKEGESTFSREQAKGRQKLADALTELRDGETDYQEGKAEYVSERADALIELTDAEREIADGEQALTELKDPEWYVLDHETNIGFLGYKQDAKRVEALSLVVPALFFLVAILVTMTSMTRLVDSDRPYIGTLKALGYSNQKIALRYLLYAVSASAAGSVIGLIAGLNILPRVIFKAYASLYTLPPLQLPFSPGLAAFSISLSVACAALPAYFACIRSLRQVPAELMRPAAPRAGKRIFLEKLPLLWRRFNFSQKVAIRNLLRYRKRLFMTLFGVAGCTALMFTGFGLRDSVTTIVGKQYDTLQSYDIQINLQQDLSPTDLAELDGALAPGKEISASAKLSQEAVDVLAGGQVKTAYLTVPESIPEFAGFVHLRNRLTGAPLSLGADTVLITEKLAAMLDLEAGDSLTLRNDDGETVAVTIGSLAENYINHYIFMSPSLYRQVFGRAPTVNQVLCRLADGAGGEDGALSARLLGLSSVTSLTFNDSVRTGVTKMVGALNDIVPVLIISAAALVFVVLFSLTSVSLEERSRELATIKVLGFLNGELATYIYRENVLLTIIGVLAGLGLGVILQRYIITTMEIDMVMFSRDLLWPSYVYSAGLTFLFAALVNLIMFKYIAKIDMISSLKSIE